MDNYFERCNLKVSSTNNGYLLNTIEQFASLATVWWLYKINIKYFEIEDDFIPSKSKK